MKQETACFERNLRAGMETQCFGNLLQYKKAILMKTLNHGKDRVPTGHPLTLNEGSSTCIGFLSVKFLADNDIHK